MKTPLLYGSLSALVGALLLFAFHFAGFYDSVEKLPTAQMTGGLVGLVAVVICMVLAIRERRSEYPADREWGYGSAFGTAFLTGFVSTVLGTVIWFAYAKYINPAVMDTILTIESAKMEAKGATDAQINGMRAMMGPVFMSIMALVLSTVVSLVIALIVAIFFRNKPAAVRSEMAAPPVV